MQYFRCERFAGSGQWVLSQPIAAVNASDACTLVAIRAAGMGADYRLRGRISRDEFERQDSELAAARSYGK